jgi:hypothetical protein
MSGSANCSVVLRRLIGQGTVLFLFRRLQTALLTCESPIIPADIDNSLSALIHSCLFPVANTNEFEESYLFVKSKPKVWGGGGEVFPLMFPHARQASSNSVPLYCIITESANNRFFPSRILP